MVIIIRDASGLPMKSQASADFADTTVGNSSTNVNIAISKPAKVAIMGFHILAVSLYKVAQD